MDSIQDKWAEVKKQAKSGKVYHELVQELKQTALQSGEVFPISFGTSGWRGIIGRDYTLFNVQRLTQAIILFFQKEVENLKGVLGIGSFSEFQNRGVLLGHDTRFMGREFAKGVAAVFNNAGVKVYYAGTTTTPEISAALKSGNFAFSVNLTASHNPTEYLGYKCNTYDGGATVSEITNMIEEYVNGISEFEIIPWDQVEWEDFDILSAYIAFIEKNHFIDLEYCRHIAQSGEVVLALDTVYGATKNRIYEILGKPENLKQFHLSTDDCHFFGGDSPEPSEDKITKYVRRYLDQQPQKLKLGAIMDADGDRVQFYDGDAFMMMNQFGALAFHHLVARENRKGGAVKTVATSNFVNVIANDLGRPIHETRVGFKNFKSYLVQGTPTPAAVCFEESDGISGYGHTFEKDGLMGFLLALEIMGKTGKSLSAYLKELQDKYGAFYPERRKIKYTLEEGDTLEKIMKRTKEFYRSGQKIKIDKEERMISRVITEEGIKCVFDDESWFLIRPSGTEPIVRIYSESISEEDAHALGDIAEGAFFAMTSSLNENIQDIRRCVRESEYQLSPKVFEKLLELFNLCLANEGAYDFLKRRSREFNPKSKIKFLLNVDRNGIAVMPKGGILQKFKDEIRKNSELFSWFNDDGSGYLLPARWLCHFFGLRHQCAHVFIDDPSFPDSTLIQLRSFDRPSSPAHFDIPMGGHADGSEKINDIVARELNQELGIRVNPAFLTKIASYGYDEPPKRPDFYNIEHRTVYIFDLINPRFQEIKFLDGEVAGIMVIRISELERLLRHSYLNKRIASGLQCSFKYYKRYKDSKNSSKKHFL